MEPKTFAGRPPYDGTERRLAIAIDVGTTYSAASYCIFDPGTSPQIAPVTTFDGERVGDAKIPTVVYYDPNGKLCGIGRKSVFQDLKMQVDEEDVTRVEWFKVHMRPKVLEKHDEEYHVDPIPFDKTVVQVFGDFLGFMYKATRAFIISRHSNGASLWGSFENRIDFVLSHPNGYEPREQALMREAAVAGGLVPNADAASARIKLVTEGEASLHYCLDQGFGDEVWEDEAAVMIVDAGGGTVDLSSFWKNASAFEETTATSCIYNGSIFVTRRASLAIRDKLLNTKYTEDIATIVDAFDSTAKLQFDSEDEVYSIPFAGRQETDLTLGVRVGKLRLEGALIATFFQPAIDAIRASILDQFNSSRKKITTIFLVGGFSESRWLFEKLKHDPQLSSAGLHICRPGGAGHKAVANGAISWYIDSRVTTRVAKYDYGVRCSIAYNPFNPEHAQRRHTVYVDNRGRSCIPGLFKRILSQDTRVSERTEFRESFSGEVAGVLSGPYLFEIAILCYKGSNKRPTLFIRDDPKNYPSLCNIRCDLTNLYNAAKSAVSLKGKPFRELKFDVILLFGLTEFKAQLAWKENGVEKRSDAVIVA